MNVILNQEINVNNIFTDPLDKYVLPHVEECNFKECTHSVGKCDCLKVIKTTYKASVIDLINSSKICIVICDNSTSNCIKERINNTAIACFLTTPKLSLYILYNLIKTKEFHANKMVKFIDN